MSKGRLSGLKKNPGIWAVFLVCSAVVGSVCICLIFTIGMCFWQKSQFTDFSNAKFRPTNPMLSKYIPFSGSFLSYDSSEFALSLHGPLSSAEWQSITPWARSRTTDIAIKFIDPIKPGTLVPNFPNLRRVYTRGIDASSSNFDPVIFAGGSHLTTIYGEGSLFDQVLLDKVAKAYPNLSRFDFVPKDPIDLSLWKSFPNLTDIHIREGVLDAAHIKEILTQCDDIRFISAAFEGPILDVLRDLNLDETSLVSIVFLPGTKGVSRLELQEQERRYKSVSLHDQW